MSIYKLANGNGIFSPQDLALMQDVLDQVCAGNDLLEKDQSRVAVGRKILLLFQTGMRDRDQLIAELTRIRTTA